MKKKLLIGLIAVALLAPMVVNANACVGPGLSPGFWKHNVGICLGYKNGEYSDPGYTAGIVTKETMGTWLISLGLDLEDLYDRLSTKGGGATGAEIRVVAANVFNDAADLFPFED